MRTAFGRRGGALANWHPVDLLAFTLQNLVEPNGGRPGPDRRRDRRLRLQVGRAVDECRPERLGGGRSSPARAWHDHRSSVRLVAAGHALRGCVVIAGHYDLAIACGVESMSRVPLASERHGGTGPFPPSYLEVIHGNLWAQFRISQVLAERWKITREDMDEYSLESHRRRG